MVRRYSVQQYLSSDGIGIQDWTVNFEEVHVYMLHKPREYYQNLPAVLVEAVMGKQKNDRLLEEYDWKAIRRAYLKIKMSMQKK